MRAVVFDLDGTLVDSLADIAGHLNTALAEAGLPPREAADVRSWVGGGIAQLVTLAVADSTRVADVVARYRSHYRAAPFGRTHVYAGLDGVLDRLAGTYVLGILSNKPQDLVSAIAAGLLARWSFAVVAGERAERPRKPDPRALVAVAEELGVAPAECALVGDSDIDILTARAAGATSIAVTWGLTDRDVLEAAKPDHLVSTPAELAALFA
ncbi:MAG: HAD-IA family hydrolase [Kofleriaceae bacterium]